MAFTAKILSWRFRHLNIVGCLLKRRPTKGWSRDPRTSLATSLSVYIYTLGDLGDSSNLIGSLAGEYKAKQNCCRKLGVLPKFQSKNFLKIQKYPRIDDSEGKKRLQGV